VNRKTNPFPAGFCLALFELTLIIYFYPLLFSYLIHGQYMQVIKTSSYLILNKTKLEFVKTQEASMA
jgi:hypothetical protein